MLILIRGVSFKVSARQHTEVGDEAFGFVRVGGGGNDGVVKKAVFTDGDGFDGVILVMNVEFRDPEVAVLCDAVFKEKVSGSGVALCGRCKDHRLAVDIGDHEILVKKRMLREKR